MSKRLTEHEAFMQIAQRICKRGTCPRGTAGCIIVRYGRILSTGYVGSLPGAPHCNEVGCEFDKPDRTGCQRTIHAEANAIVWAARNGIQICPSTLYATLGPCIDCAKLIAMAGVETVYYDIPYRLRTGINFLLNAGITVYEFDGFKDSERKLQTL